MTGNRRWGRPALVLAIDLLWGVLLERLGRPLFVGLYPGQSDAVNHFLDHQLIPSLWFSYGLVLTAQISWLSWAERKRRRWQACVALETQRRRLRRAWWIGALLQLTLSIGLQLHLAFRLGPPPDGGALLFVLGLLLCDLILIYWLPTALLMPEKLRGSLAPWMVQ